MKIAWLFPGQGSQEVGMGRDVAERFSAARDVFDRADRALAGDGTPISTLCFEGPLDALTLTENTQPALVATECALVAAPAPAFALGHSLGEYSALVASGALDVEQAVRLCRARGRAMQAAVPPGEGSMAAVLGSDEATVEAACVEASSVGVVSAANFNANGQIVIAGAVAAVARACEILTAGGKKVIPLKVSAPFHCALMRPAATAHAAAPNSPASPCVMASVGTRAISTDLRARQQRNFLTTLLLSQGVPMIAHGDELGRTQDGNNNVYCQDNELSWVDWVLTDEQKQLLAFTKTIVALRANHPVFRRRRFFAGSADHGGESHLGDIYWLKASGDLMSESDWAAGEARLMGMWLNGSAIPEPDGRGRRILDDDFLIIFNAGADDATFTLPTGAWGGTWSIEVDTGADVVDGECQGAGSALPVGGRSIVVLRSRREEPVVPAGASPTAAT